MRSPADRRIRTLPILVALATLDTTSLSGCVPNRGAASAGRASIAVVSSDTACRVSATTIPIRRPAESATWELHRRATLRLSE